MNNIKLWQVSLAVFVVFFLFGHSYARAVNNPNPKLDAIASQVAGKPVTVVCEDDPEAWQAAVRLAYKKPTMSGFEINGYAWIGQNTVYLAPNVCVPLLTAVIGTPEWAGYQGLTLGLSVLLHESMHAAGIKDEGEAECAMLRLFPSYLGSVGIPAKVVRYAKVGTLYRKTLVVNQIRSLMIGYSRTIHRSLPIQYQGGC